MLVRREAGSLHLPTGRELAEAGLPAPTDYPVGRLGGNPAFAGVLPEAAEFQAPVERRASPDVRAGEAESERPDGLDLVGLRALHALLPADALALASRSAQLLEWHRTHRFCGVCGAATDYRPGDEARRCPGCGHAHFPRVSPAVITLVQRGEEILLARSPHFAPGVYSTLAGFVEPGESLEEAVAREIREEVGVEVEDVRYFGSQPWPFPHSLMIGFTAVHAGGDIECDGVEIEDAGWYRRDSLPSLPSRISISRRLVDSFLAES